MAFVKAQVGEELDVLIARFKRAVQKEGILEKVKEHMEYLPKSVIRHRKNQEKRFLKNRAKKKRAIFKSLPEGKRNKILNSLYR